MVFFLFLPLYTRHGSAVLVPDITNMDQEDAMKAIREAGLKYEIRDSSYQPALEPLTVLKQYPVPFSRVKPKRMVYLTINKATPPTVKLPKVIDLSLYNAKAKLESWRLAVDRVRYRPDIAKGIVLEVRYEGKKIAKDTKLPMGAAVELIVGEGLNSRNRVAVPDLSGLSYMRAILELRRYDLNIGATAFDETITTPSLLGKVYDQSPKAVPGDSIPRGSAIDLFIYGPEPEEPVESIDPDADSLYQAEMEAMESAYEDEVEETPTVEEEVEAPEATEVEEETAPETEDPINSPGGGPPG